MVRAALVRAGIKERRQRGKPLRYLRAQMAAGDLRHQQMPPGIPSPAAQGEEQENKAGNEAAGIHRAGIVAPHPRERKPG